jgi:hypothetical protein
MSENLEYVRGRQMHGHFVAGAPASWGFVNFGDGARAVHRAYDKGYDFFTVHWQVNDSDSGVIRLHVEAPRFDTDATLNDIKRDVIRVIEASNVAQVVSEQGYSYVAGPKTTDDEIRRFKSTEVFRVKLDDDQRQPTPEQSIEGVHAAVGSAVRMVLERFARTLNLHFPP